METKKKESYMKMFEAFLDEVDDKEYYLDFVVTSLKFKVKLRGHL